MDEADALEALSNVLSQLTANPYDIALHAENVRIATQTGMEDQLESALEMVTTFWAAGDRVWLPLIDLKLKSVDIGTVEGCLTMLELFERAERDYLSIPILRKHIEFLIDRYDYFKELDSRPEELGELFSMEWTRGAIAAVASEGSGHLTQSYRLWDLHRDWELEHLQEATPEEKPQLTAYVESMLLDRLKEPHSNHDETFQTYSTFTTNYKLPDEYEPLLVQASKMKSQAVKAFQRREAAEMSISQAKNSPEAFAYYIASERRAKKPDLSVLTAMYERAIAETDKRRFAGEPNAEETLRSFWIGYVDTLRLHNVEETQQSKVFQRATRSVPGSGEVWARYIRFLERTANEDTSVSTAYHSAMSFTPMQKDIEQLVPLVLARAGYEKRKVEAGVAAAEGFGTLIQVLTDGISKVRKASKTGDPRLRLEKYMSALCIELADIPENAIALWEDTTKHYKTSYLAWTAYTDVLIRQQMYDDARKVFKDIVMKNLDWPEAMWEAWISFEHLHGTVQELEEAMDRVERAQYQVNARRAKEAEKAAYQAMQVSAEQQAPNVPVTEAPIPSTSSTQIQTQEIPMDIDTPQLGATASKGKRKAEDEIEHDHEDTKKAKMEQKPPPLKRDRENCTVFVADLPTGTEDADLVNLFKDCGTVREVKITQLPNSLVATVEFMDRDSVPAALTKDKKRVHDQEIAVHLAWQSTLYVTNFPEHADDAFIRDLFGKYGVIFDVRWPSKKFKSTRRFCYVQYTSPNSAKAALELHGSELEPGHNMSVFLSNPERRKERTDVDANDKEIYVAGVSKFATKEELRKLFSTYGKVKDIRMGTDANGKPKGFAFVEFEQAQEATAALSANNFELKNRRIAVTLADTRVRPKAGAGKKAEVQNRSVRVKKLPPNTQEGLLQQALEKVAKVKRVEIFNDKNEAVIELENASDAGKLLLRTEPIEYNGATLEIVEEPIGSSSSSRASGPPMATGFVPRTTVNRPRAGLGSKKARTVVSAAVGPTTVSSSPQPSAPVSTASGGTQKGQDDFRKMLGGS
ncbi:hypothetical protein ABKN59_002266 [Abortiporus biennis]